MSITIDRDIPIPPKRHGGGRRARYPWKRMKIGDSFEFPKKIKRTTASSLCYRAGKVLGRSFATRMMDDCIRCWRLY